MPQITVTVNNHAYVITCDAGQERHVEALAAALDLRIAATVRELGQAGEARLLLVTSLMILDDLAAAEAEAGDPAAQAGLQRLDRLEQDAARAIDGLAQRVEAVAARLEAS